MIKMSEVYEIDADFENMKISFIGKKNVLLGSIGFLSLAVFKEEHSKSIKALIASLQGKKITLHLPPTPSISLAKKSYGKGNLFMEYSGSKNL